MFCSAELAARIERAECRLISDFAAAVRRSNPGLLEIPVASGLATHGGPNSPLNKVAGLGFNSAAPGTPGPTLESGLEEVERLWFTLKTPVQVELSSLGDPSVGETLTRRGYTLRGFENVLGCPLPRTPQHSRPGAERIDIEPSGQDTFREWFDAVVTGFATPDTQGVASHESYPREAIEAAMRDMVTARGFSRFLARRAGEVAGGATLRVGDGVAHLSGAATLPAHRRRGVQTALFEHRLTAAAQAGCDIAVVVTLPGSKSQENAQKRGFSLLYTRAILVADS